VGIKLTNLEREIIEIFVRIAGVLHLPRSVGELYGLLFVSEKPLCLDDCRLRLGISKGSTSQGLRILRSFGAVSSVYVPGERRDFFEAESELRRIVSGFVNEQIRPHLENGKARMSRMEAMLEAEPSGRQVFLEERLDRLKTWQKHANTVLPFALNFIKPD